MCNVSNIFIILVINFMQGIYKLYTQNKPCHNGIQCCSCSVFTDCATCNVISPVKCVLYCHISTYRSMCAVPNMAVFYTSLISCFPHTLFRYCLSDSEMVPVTPIITGIAESEREGTRAETRIGLSAKRTSPFKSAWGQFSRLLAVEECG